MNYNCCDNEVLIIIHCTGITFYDFFSCVPGQFICSCRRLLLARSVEVELCSSAGHVRSYLLHAWNLSLAINLAACQAGPCRHTRPVDTIRYDTSGCQWTRPAQARPGQAGPVDSNGSESDQLPCHVHYQFSADRPVSPKLLTPQAAIEVKDASDPDPHADVDAHAHSNPKSIHSISLHCINSFALMRLTHRELPKIITNEPQIHFHRWPT